MTQTQARERKQLEDRERIFVREISGRYGEISKDLFEGPRVFHSTDVEYRGGPQHFNKTIVSPEVAGASQIFHSHLDIYVPGSRSQKHAHMNSAVFYILEGRGHDIHDGKRLDWKAGDVVIVEPGCVHQHFNDSDTEFVRTLVIKAKPVFMFTELIFQKMIERNLKVPVPGYEDVDAEAVDPFYRKDGAR
jgi:mannose-6-phosphate isomerase-like protein (cupin superfamily)